LGLAARAARLQDFLFDSVTMYTATEVTVQWQVNRTRGARVLKRFMAAEHSDCFVSPAAFCHLFQSAGALLALKL
jgi:hypothetical protein